MPRKSVSYHIFNVFLILFFIIVALMMVIPFLNVVCLSLEPNNIAIETGSLHLIPQKVTFVAYKQVFKNELFTRSFLNSVFITLTGSMLGVILTAMLGYGLTYERIFGNRFCTYLILFTMMFSGGTIPTYILYKNMKMLDTYWVLILPGILSAYNTILMKSFFSSLPSSLQESAFLDGASEIVTFFKIIIPLSMPIFATITLFIAVSQWNGYFAGMVYISDANKKPLMVILREILMAANYEDDTSGGSTDIAQLGENVRMAVCIVAIVPIICVYPFLQKHFTKGVLLGAVKG